MVESILANSCNREVDRIEDKKIGNNEREGMQLTEEKSA